MRYRVALAKRFEADGNESTLDPSADLDLLIPDGVVAEKVFVERLEPESQHSQEVFDEDDGFLASASTEVWEYEIVDDRKQEFEDALSNSERVIEFDVIDEGGTDEGDAVSVDLSSSQEVSDPQDPGQKRGSRATSAGGASE